MTRVDFGDYANYAGIVDLQSNQLRFNYSQQTTQFHQITSTQVLSFYGCIANRKKLLTNLNLDPSSGNSVLLLALFHHAGLKMASLIEGDAVWLIWDSQRKRLIFFRDRMGSHCFYYSLQQGQCLLFSNSIKRLTEPGKRNRQINEISISRHLNKRPPLAGQTFYKNVNCVPAGHIFEFKRGQVYNHRYWQLDAGPTLHFKTEIEYSQALLEILNTVFSEYSIDNHSGITLSSGIDSSLVAAFLVRHKFNLSAFSWAMHSIPEADESRFSLQTANHLGININWINATKYWTFKSPRISPLCFDTPYRLYYEELLDETFRSAAASGVGTLYTGLGGDHLFGASATPFADLLLTGRIFRLFKEIHHFQKYTNWNIKNIIRYKLLGKIARTYLQQLPRRKNHSLQWLGPRTLDVDVDNSKITYNQFILPDRRQRLLILSDSTISRALEITTAIANKNKIRLVHPLLDHRLFEFAAKIPSQLSYKNGYTKHIMREVTRDALPYDVINMRGKIYPTKLGELGLKYNEKNKVISLLTHMHSQELGFVNENKLNQDYQSYLSGKINRSDFWLAITLEQWLRENF